MTKLEAFIASVAILAPIFTLMSLTLKSYLSFLYRQYSRDYESNPDNRFRRHLTVRQPDEHLRGNVPFLRRLGCLLVFLFYALAIPLTILFFPFAYLLSTLFSTQ